MIEEAVLAKTKMREGWWERRRNHIEQTSCDRFQNNIQ
jgi:hypothetical protein